MLTDEMSVVLPRLSVQMPGCLLSSYTVPLCYNTTGMPQLKTTLRTVHIQVSSTDFGRFFGLSLGDFKITYMEKCTEVVAFPSQLIH
jgi:hypothetical protein